MTQPQLATDPTVDDELRLPREPGVFRRFWARHPRLVDTLVTLTALLLSFSGVVVSSSDALPTIPTPVTITIVLVSYLACLSLFWRRRYPRAVFVIIAIPFLIALPFGPAVSGPAVAIAGYGLGVYRPQRDAVIFGIGFFVAVGLMTLLAVFIVGGDAKLAANVAIAAVVTALVGLLLGTNIGNRRRYHEAVIERSRQLLVERDQRARLAASAERSRIAREMHDIVSHSLTVVVALSDGLQATNDPAQSARAAAAIGTTARSALTEMRSMLGVLRSEDAEDAPLVPTVARPPAETVEAAQRAGFPVTLTTSGPDDPSEHLRFAISRIVQEGLTNAMRHAPTASFIRVSIDTDREVTIRIVNDGATSSRSGDGFGLRGIAERAAHLGGTATVEHVGGTWTLTARLPLVTPPQSDDPTEEPAREPGHDH